MPQSRFIRNREIKEFLHLGTALLQKEYRQQNKRETPIYNPKPKPKQRKVVLTNTFIPYKDALDKVMTQYDSRGYNSACELTQSLYTDSKINLQQKSNLMNELANTQMMTTKQRKWMKKL